MLNSDLHAVLARSEDVCFEGNLAPFFAIVTENRPVGRLFSAGTDRKEEEKTHEVMKTTPP
jgi:hypothetical protein